MNIFDVKKVLYDYVFKGYINILMANVLENLPRELMVWFPMILEALREESFHSNPCKINRSNACKINHSNPCKINHSNPCKINHSNPC